MGELIIPFEFLSKNYLGFIDEYDQSIDDDMLRSSAKRFLRA